MVTKEKVRCEKCGWEMNRHAEKIDYAAALEHPKMIIKDFSGILMSFHKCPNCGNTQTKIETA